MSGLRAISVGVAVFVTTVVGLRAQQPAAPAGPCHITGRVTGIGQPLPGVSIAARRGDAVQAATSTGLDGTYRLTIPAGTYSIAAELTGFERVARDMIVTADTCQQAFDVTLALSPRVRTTAPAVPVQQGAPAAATPSGRGAAPGAPAAAGAQQRFQTLAVQADAAGLTLDAEPATDANLQSLLPPGFGAEASADAIAVNGNSARVDRGQLNDRADALGRGDFAIGGPDGGAFGGFGPGGGGGFQGGRGGPGGDAAQGGGPGGRGGFVIGGRGGRQGRIQASADYTFGGSALDSSPYQLRSGGQAQERPYTRQNFGSTLGGPLKIPRLYDGTNRTTFNLGYSGSRGSNLFDQYATVPTPAMRVGDFSTSPVALLDPTTGQPFEANQIPAGMMSPQALSLLRFIPLPNLDGTSRNYHYTTTTGSINDSVNLRLTHNFTPNSGRGGGGRGGGARGAGAGGAAGRGGRGAAARGTSVSMTAQVQYRRGNGDQTNVFSTLGGRNQSTTVGVPVSFNVVRGRGVHALNVNVSRSSSTTRNNFAGVENVAAAAGIQGVGTDPFAWGVPALSFSSVTSLRDVTPSRRADHRSSVGYTWSRPITRHMLRAGGDFRFDRATNHTETNAAGSFTFTGLYTSGGSTRVSGADFADFLLGMPQQASLQYGPGDVTMEGKSMSLFLQDDWRARPNLTFNLGLRYELLWPLVETHKHMANLDVTPDFSAAAPVLAGQTGAYSGEFPTGLLLTDKNNLAPRVGFAWRTRQGAVVRGGYGISFNSGAYAGIARNLASQPPFSQTNTRIGGVNSALLMEDALAGRTPDVTTNNFGVDKDYVLGRVQTWNIDISKNVGRSWTTGAGYTRTTGANLDIVRAPNRGPDGLRIPGVQPFTWQSSEGSSVLNSATFRLQRRQVRGIGGGVTYTLARSRDNAPSIGGGGGGSGALAQDDQNLEAEWALSNFDRRHRFGADLQIQLPFGANRRWLANGGPWAAILENWRLTTTFSADAGTPLTPRVTGATRDVAQGINGALRADYSGAPISVGDQSIDQFFNTSAFGVPASGIFGSSPRNIITGPGSKQLDAQLARDVRLGGTRAVTIQLRASNLLNLVNYGAVDTSVNSPTFGQVLSVRPMRSMTLNLRFRF